MNFKQNQKIVTLILLFLAVTFLVASFYIKQKQQGYRSAIEANLAKKEVRMISLAELIDRDGADAVTNQIVTDCQTDERQKFDQLLGSLSQLNRQNLLEVKKLFDTCGSFYSDRQAILAMRLNSEYENYYEQLQLLTQTGANTKQFEDRQSQWLLLNEVETKRSANTSTLVSLQDSIIELLVADKLIQSAEISVALEKAQEVKDLISFLNIQADELRGKLSTL